MASQARVGSLSRAAIHAQKRRDNEVEAREVLCKRLPEEAFRPEYSTRGEFNLTTKTLLATLHFLDPHVNIPEVTRLDTSAAEYNRHRRANETSIRDCLESVIPTSLFTSEITERSDFNKTTKVMIAAYGRVQEVLLEREEAQPTTSFSPEPENIVFAAQVPIVDRFDSPPREARRSLRIRQGSFIPQKQATSSPEQAIGLGRDEYTLSAINPRSIQPPIWTQPGNSQSIMSPSTRSSSNSKEAVLSLIPEVSPRKIYASDDTISDSNPSETGDDLLINLHADELDQEMKLDVKPPSLHKKAFENQGHWQIKPRDITQHDNIYVRALEQAANRLVAKARELVIVYDGDDTACQKPLMEAQEWCVDTISMITGEIESKDYRKKWNAKKKMWSRREDCDLSFDD